jgi:HAD domain in Swiss Army Knife RNA repair proteins
MMRSAKKVLYLDFDGVLHDQEVHFHPKWGIFIKTPGRTLFEWMSILDDLLAPHPEVNIVLSTSWVRVRSFNFARSQLSSALQQRVVGATYHRRAMYKDVFDVLPRGEQIAQDVYRRGPSAWFAIDDDALCWPQWCRDNLIKTHGSTGISDPLIQSEIRIMLERF